MSASADIGRIKRALASIVCGDMQIDYAESVSIVGVRFVPFRVYAPRDCNSTGARTTQYGRWYLCPIDHTDAYVVALAHEAFVQFESHEIREKMESNRVYTKQVYPHH